MRDYPIVWPASWEGLMWHERQQTLGAIDEAFERLERGQIPQPVAAISNYSPDSEWYRHKGNTYIYWGNI